MQNNFSTKSLIFASSDLTPKKCFELEETDFEKYKTKEFFDMQKTFEKYEIFSICRGEEKFGYFENITSKPYFIFGIGNLELLEKNILAIVGPRNPSEYGKQVVEKLLENLNGYDAVTISGLANGIDQLAHENSIKNNIPTIAILGGGIGYFLKNQKNLLEKILDSGGLILSEYKPLMTPTKFSFPQRNRIVAGLAQNIFIPEAEKKSGSLITADFAQKMGKNIFGTPNSIFSENSQGLNEYLSHGIIRSVNDLEIFVQTIFGAKKINSQKITNIQINFENESQKKIYDIILQNKKISSLELQHQSGLDFGTILIELTTLQIQNLVYEIYPGIFCIKNT